MPDDVAFLPPDYDPRIARFFCWWTRDKMVAKKFNAVRLAEGSRAVLESVADHRGPLIGVMNHTSWWDPLVMMAIHSTFCAHRRAYAPMDIAQLRKLGIFRKVGTFGVDPDDPRSLDAMAAYLHDEFQNRDRPLLWINPQGRFEDVRTEIEVRPGAARIAADATAAGLDVRVISVAIEYVFWLDPKPELLIRVEAVEPERTNTPGWLRATRSAMRTNAGALARLAMARDPAGFEHLLGDGRAKINPMYDWWLRLRGKRADLVDRSRASEAPATD